MVNTEISIGIKSEEIANKRVEVKRYFEWKLLKEL